MRFLRVYKSSFVFGLVWGLISLVACQASTSSVDRIQPPTLEEKSKASAQALSTVQIIAGTYNQKGSEGIYAFELDVPNLKFTEPRLIAKDDNPSFLHIEQGTVYVANELGNGRLSRYQWADGSGMTLKDSVATRGASPCYVSMSPDKSFIATANYMGGNLSVFKLNSAGDFVGEPQILQHSGRGPNKSRQESAHAHWVQWSQDQNWLYAVDLGIDEVKVYPFDQASGKVGVSETALKLSPGDGPRHMYFHPLKPFTYILNELSNTITVAGIKANGTLEPVQTIDTLPENFTGHNQGGHIYVDKAGNTLYASNRGHDSIAVFSILDNGQLRLSDIEPTQGRWPRHFLVLENEGVVLVANQESHNIVLLAMTDGALSTTGVELELPQVTFLGRVDPP